MKAIRQQLESAWYLFEKSRSYLVGKNLDEVQTIISDGSSVTKTAEDLAAPIETLADVQKIFSYRSSVPDTEPARQARIE